MTIQTYIASFDHNGRHEITAHSFDEASDAAYALAGIWEDELISIDSPPVRKAVVSDFVNSQWVCDEAQDGNEVPFNMYADLRFIEDDGS